MRNEVIDGFELPSEKVHLVPNGVDTDDAALDWATTDTPSPGTANP